MLLRELNKLFMINLSQCAVLTLHTQNIRVWKPNQFLQIELGFSPTRTIVLTSLFTTASLHVSSRGIVANVMVCDIVVREFELQLRHFVHFQTNTLEKHMNRFVS